MNNRATNGIETILCAAIWYQDLPLKKEFPDLLPKNCDRGIVICGHRHPHCMWTMGALTGLRSISNAPDGVGEYTQGFLTSHNRFVDRKEGAEIHIRNGGTLHYNDELYSEDLY